MVWHASQRATPPSWKAIAGAASKRADAAVNSVTLMLFILFPPRGFYCSVNIGYMVRTSKVVVLMNSMLCAKIIRHRAALYFQVVSACIRGDFRLLTVSFPAIHGKTTVITPNPGRGLQAL
jgi:hypothetical protein